MKTLGFSRNGARCLNQRKGRGSSPEVWAGVCRGSKPSRLQTKQQFPNGRHHLIERTKCSDGNCSVCSLPWFPRFSPHGSMPLGVPCGFLFLSGSQSQSSLRWLVRKQAAGGLLRQVMQRPVGAAVPSSHAGTKKESNALCPGRFCIAMNAPFFFGVRSCGCLLPRVFGMQASF